MGTQLKGKPIQVVVVDGHSFKLDGTALSEILLDPRVENLPVFIVSVAGECRTGKSFLLNFFLRYFSAPNDPNWLGDVDSPLNGFSWRGGSERDTTGILMWSEPFIIKRGEEEVAVLLMDTQGAFDSETSVKGCTTVFALSTLLSSVQVYNLSSKIRENDLQHLQLFTEYGRLALESNKDVKPFQTLQFLVRDWSNEHEYSNGEEGGRKLLERTLQVSDNQQPELKQLRNHITSCFRKIDCYLMPHPGLRATKAAFEGRLKDMEEDFQEHIKQYIEFLLHPKNLVVKKINDTIFTGKELLVYFKAYMNIFQGDTLPEPKSVYITTAEANNLAAVATAKDMYGRQMELTSAPDKPYLKLEHLEREHRYSLEMALDSFNQTRKMGDAEFSQQYEEKLKLELQALYKKYIKRNKKKGGVIKTIETCAFAVGETSLETAIGVLPSVVKPVVEVIEIALKLKKPSEIALTKSELMAVPVFVAAATVGVVAGVVGVAAKTVGVVADKICD